MIEAIKEIGEYIKRKEKISEEDIFNDITKLRKTKKIICIILSRKKEKYYYERISCEDYSSKKIIYRGGKPQGADLLPTSIITEVKKTFNSKIIRWFETRKEDNFKKISEVLKSNKEKIEKELEKEFNNLRENEKNNVLLTIKIKENNEEKHIREIKEFKDILRENVIKDYYYRRSIGESKGEGICYLCDTNKEKIYGYVLPTLGFSFATSDKKGFTYNFVQTSKWKEIPICEDCAILLEIGKRFLDKNLRYPKKDENSFGYKYYVIPKFVFSEMFNEFYQYIKIFEEKEYEEGLLCKEDWLEEILKEKKDVLRLIILFYELKGGGKYIDIVNYIEEVIPSWIKKIDETQKDIKKYPLFEENSMKKIFGKEWVGDFIKGRINKDKGLGKNNWYAIFTKDFFHNRHFFEVINAIFSEKIIEKDFLISGFMEKIREAIKKKDIYNMKTLCLKSFMLYLFLKKLNLLKENVKLTEKDINKEKNVNYTSMQKEKSENILEEFFKNYNFDNPAKRAAFSVGLVVNYLLYIQRRERKVGFGEEPFLKNLHGLRMDEKIIKRIFVEAINKLREYRKGDPIEAIAGKYLAEAEGKWNITKGDISYYFALGLTLRESLSIEEIKKEGEKYGSEK